MTEYFVRPDGGGAGVGIWSNGRVHDLHKGRDLKSAQTTMQPFSGLCDHKLNPNTCLECFHARNTARPTAQAKPKPGQAHVPSNPVVAAVRASALGGQRSLGGPVPQVSTPTHVGKRPDGTDIVPEPEVLRGPMPRPVLTTPGMPAPGAAQAAAREPFTHANETWIGGSLKLGEDGRWHGAKPPKRREMMDARPSHPNARDGVMKPG